MRPAVLRGWIFPDVPATARLFYAVGEVGLVAAATYALSGQSAHGGVGYLFDPTTVEGLGSRDFRCRLLAAGFGILNPESSHAGGANVAPGAPVPILGAGGLLAGVVAAPLRYTHLHIGADVNLPAVYYRADGAASTGVVGVGDERAFKLREGVLAPAADVLNAGGAPANIYAHLNCDNREELETFTAFVGREEFAGGASLGRRDLALDTAPLRAQMLTGTSALPDLYPIQPGAAGALLDQNERWTMRLVAPANLRCYASSLCKARALYAVAVWNHADETGAA